MNRKRQSGKKDLTLLRGSVDLLFGQIIDHFYTWRDVIGILSQQIADLAGFYADAICPHMGPLNDHSAIAVVWQAIPDDGRNQAFDLKTCHAAVKNCQSFGQHFSTSKHQKIVLGRNRKRITEMLRDFLNLAIKAKRPDGSKEQLQ